MHTCLCSRCRRYAHVCVWTHVLMHMCIHTEAKDQSPVSFSTLFRLLFETRFLTKPGACQLCRLTGQQAPKICLSPALLCWGTSTHHLSDYVFPWVLGFPTDVSKLVHQALYWPSHFSRPLYHSLSGYYTAIVTLMIKFYYSSKHIDHKILKHELKSLI